MIILPAQIINNYYFRRKAKSEIQWGAAAQIRPRRLSNKSILKGFK